MSAALRSFTTLGKSVSSKFTIQSTPKSFSSDSSAIKKKILNSENISPKIKNAAYAVRGELVIRAADHSKTLELQKKLENPIRLPFDKIVYCNIGNPQSLGQKPLTYFRQILSLVEYPDLLNNPVVEKIYPSDVIQRAKEMISETAGGTGAYSHSQGLAFVRRHIAEFIEKRDGHPANPDNIFITNGASPAVQNVLRLLIRDEKDGIMIPIPQYPLYSASIAMQAGYQIGYYLKEEDQWGLEVDELSRSYDEAVKLGVKPRALVIINPGNPTGQVLKKHNMEQIIKFCSERHLILMADEVYQENVYIKEQKPFYSFKKILKDMGSKYKDFELFSFHSISKGFVGECGHRSGYVECVGIDPNVKAELYKLASVSLCPNTAGQVIMDVMVKPPAEGEASYAQYKSERDSIYESLARRAKKLTSFLDGLPGISCNASEGAMYAFPQIILPEKAVAAAALIGKRPDDFYAMELLDATGVCVIPGSGFGQKEGTYHFRTTFLPSEDEIDSVMEKVGVFHRLFMEKYST